MNNITSWSLFAEKSLTTKTTATSTSVWELLIYAGAIILLLGAIYATIRTVAWYRRRALQQSPIGLWNDLCQAHQLDKLQILALEQLANLRELSPPALIFVQPQRWQLDAAKNRLGAQIEILRKLEQRLFR